MRFCGKIQDKSQRLQEGETYDPETFVKEIHKKVPLPRQILTGLGFRKDVRKDTILGQHYTKFSGYRIGSLVGEGSFGQVFQCWDNATGQEYAVKRQDKKKIVQQKMQKAILNEMLVMKALKGCPSIVQLSAEFEDKKNVYFIMDFCGGGDVFDRINTYFEKRGLFTEAHAAALMRNMLQAVHECHTNHVIHRDIKPENFLVHKSNNEVSLKLTDFGLAAFCPPGEHLTERCGTPHYVSPEMWRDKPYGKEVDVWALGICLLVILCGRMPYDGESLQEIANATQHDLNFVLPPWGFLSDKAVDLATRMLKVDPLQRITVEEALHHEWIREGGCADNKSLHTQVRDGLRQLRRSTNMERAALRLLAVAMQDKLALAVARFHMMDTDGDNLLDRNELMKQASKDFGMIMMERELPELFDALDYDCDGKVTLDEFILGIIQMRMHIDKTIIERAFAVLDLDGDGFINRDELKTALSKSGEPLFHIDEFFNLLDLDGDGRITFEEFRAHWDRAIAESSDDILEAVTPNINSRPY